MKRVLEPRLARRLVALLAADEDREYLLTDLREAYRMRLERYGRATAWRWYWWQALRAIPVRLMERRRSLEPRRAAGVTGRVHPGFRLRLAARVFQRRPLYALGVAGTLGLGLGSAAAVFAVAWGIWFRPLPFPDPGRVVRVFEVDLEPERKGEGSDVAMLAAAESPPASWNAISPPLSVDMQNASLSTIASVAAVSVGEFDLTDVDRVRRVRAALVSWEAFGILGVRPLHGRLPSGEAGVREVVVTEAFWREWLGADPSLDGRSLVLDGERHEVVGVIAPPAGYPERAELWAPLHFDDAALAEGMRGARYLDAIARVRPGRTVAEAAAEVDAFVRGLAESHPNHRGWGGHVVSLREHLVRPYRGVLAMLLAAGGAFVLLAVVNVAGLVAARRAEDRQPRTVRLALGATRGRILGESILEGALLGLAAAFVAAVGAVLVLAPVKRLIPAGVPRLDQVAVGGGTLLGLFVAGLAAGTLIGALGHAMSGVKDTSLNPRDRDAGRIRVRGRRVLIVTQVALTTWLLAGGLALLRQVNELRRVDPGFRAAGVVSVPLVLSSLRQGANAELSLSFWDDVLERLDGRGVVAAFASNPPVSGSNMHFGYGIQGESSEHFGQYHSVSPAYFDVLGIAIHAGRAFSASDVAGSEPVVIVNEALEREHFGDQNPIGRTIHVAGTPRRIVGVARSTSHFGPDREPPAELYVPLAQDPWPFGHILVRDGAGVSPGLLGATISEIDPDLPVPPLLPFERHVTEWFAPLRLQLLVIGVFGTVGAMLAALGVYALVAFLVSDRTREIGIRRALGEPTTRLLARILGDSLATACLGAVAGLALAVASRAALRSLVSGIDATVDLATALVVVVTVAGIALLSSTLPARRATAIDPMITLR